MKSTNDIKRAMEKLTDKEIEIMRLENKLERCYEQRRELVNYLNLNKKEGAQ